MKRFVVTCAALAVAISSSLYAQGEFGDPAMMAGDPEMMGMRQGGFNQGGFNQGFNQGGFNQGFNNVNPAFGAAPQGNAGFGNANFTGGFNLPTPVASITVIRGDRIYDAVDGETLLSDYEMAQVPESEKNNYSNNGDGDMGDVVRDDDYWTNTRELRDSFIGPESQAYLLKYINMLRLLHRMDPLSFSAVRVASPDPVSPLPLLDDFEEEQQTRILDWNEKFLLPFRVPDEVTGERDPRGEFYPVFVPTPPFYRPVRPDVLNPTPDLAFLEEAWVLYNGGEPNTQRLTHLQDQTQQQQGFYGPQGAGAPGAEPQGDVFGGTSAREWEGRSTYFGNNPK